MTYHQLDFNAYARAADPETSQAAARAFRRGTIRHRLLEQYRKVGHLGWTDEEASTMADVIQGWKRPSTTALDLAGPPGSTAPSGVAARLVAPENSGPTLISNAPPWRTRLAMLAR